MVIVVLVSFAAGCAVGVVAMVPAWWRRRAGRAAPAAAADEPGASPTPTGPAASLPVEAPRHGV
jgi:hypothetical protein